MLKKKLVISLFIIIFLTSCIERGDWIYDDLPGDYSIWRINSRSISLCRNIEEGMASTIVTSYVSEIDYNDEYKFAKQVSVPENPREKIDKSNPDYYILVVENEELFGPYTEDEFVQKCDELDIEHTLDWKITTDFND